MTLVRPEPTTKVYYPLDPKQLPKELLFRFPKYRSQKGRLCRSLDQHPSLD